MKGLAHCLARLRALSTAPRERKTAPTTPGEATARGSPSRWAQAWLGLKQPWKLKGVPRPL